MHSLVPSARTKLKRMPERGACEQQQLYDILDEGLVAHVAMVQDDLPLNIPMGYARQGNRVLLHGSISSRLMKAMKQGIDVCITVTLLDGVVLARSTFHHDMNYRSVVVFGRTQAITEPAEKDAALLAFVEQICPGRTADTRPSTKAELTSTAVIAVPLDEASAKINQLTATQDDKADYEGPTWAGIVPLKQTMGTIIADPKLKDGIPMPEYVSDYSRTSRTR